MTNGDRDLSTHAAFQRLVTTAEPDQLVSVRVRIDGAITARRGRLSETGSDYLVLATETSAEYVAAEEVIGFEVFQHADTKAAGEDPRGAPAELELSVPTTTEGAMSVVEAPPETDSLKPAPPAGAAATTAGPAPKRVSFARPLPDFTRTKGDLAEEVRADWVHAFNIFNYAQKVNEPQRVLTEIRPLSHAAELADEPRLLTLAAQLALYADAVDDARRLFARAADDGDLLALFGQTVCECERGDWVRAVWSLSQFLASDAAPEGEEEWSDLLTPLWDLLSNVPTGFAVEVLRTMDDAALSEVRRNSVAEFLADFGARDVGEPAVRAPSGSTAASPPAMPVVPLQPGVPSEEPEPAPAPLTPSRSEVVRTVGRVSRYTQRDGQGFVVVGVPGGQRSVWFDHACVADAPLAKALEGGWTGTVSFVEETRIHEGRTRRVATQVCPVEPISDFTPTPRRLPKAAAVLGTGRQGRLTLQNARGRELDQDLDAAQRIYEEIIVAGGREAPTAVKELAWLLNRRNQWRDAIGVLDKHTAYFSKEDRRAVDNLRLNILLKGRQYEDARVVIGRLERGADQRQWLALQKQHAYCLIGMMRLDEADEILEAAEVRFPTDPGLGALRDRIADMANEPGSVDLASFQNIAAGITEFSIYYLENSGLMGADERSKARGYFDARDFQLTFKFFEGIQGHRPRERAEVMLTLAYMCWKDPFVAGDMELSELLRRFFSLMAESHSASASDPDVVRAFATEAIGFCSPDQVHREVPVLLGSYLPLKGPNLVGDKWKSLSEDFEGNPSAWQAFLAHLPYFESRTPHFRPVLDKYLVSINPRLAIDGVEQEERIEQAAADALLLRTLVTQLVRDESEHLRPVELDEIAATMQQRSSEAVFALDRRRLAELGDIVAEARRFFERGDFTERRGLYDRVRGRLLDYLESIEQGATMLSVVALRRFATSLLQQIESDQADYLKVARVQMTVSDVLENEEYQVGPDQSIKLALLVDVSASGPPIEGVVLRVDEPSTLEVLSAPEPVAVLHGGQRELRIHVRLSPTEIGEKAFTLTGALEFTAQEKAEQFPFSVPIRLTSDRPFEPIDNPYESYSGGSVVSDPAMFYGREELLKRIVKQVTEGPMGQCYLLYGQKRSGKSSVLEQVALNLALPNIAVKVTMGELDTVDANYSFLRVCVSELKEALREHSLYDLVDWNTLEPSGRVGLDDFKAILRSVKRALEEHLGGQPRIIYLVDEFTYMLGYIRSEVVPKSFMRQWKALIESHLINTVVAGQDSMPRFKALFPNEFGVTRDERLSYLTLDASRALAEEPISTNGRSRYAGRSVERLIYYAGGSPWFLQIMCDRLVQHLNAERAQLATEFDIEEVVRNLTSGEHRLALETFDPLITASGDSEDPFDTDVYLNVLRQVAWLLGQQRAGARPVDISLEGYDQVTTNQVIEDLVARDVIRRSEQGLLKISVGLFEWWLRVNRPIGASPGGYW